MGCFSFMCKECGKAVLSSSFKGNKVELFLLKDSKTIQHMSGEYDSYGRVFIDGTQVKDVKHSLRESVHWKNPFPEKPLSKDEVKFGEESAVWRRVSKLMFSENSGDGIAAVHTECYKGVPPTTRSERDPNQGWGACEDD